MNKILLLSLTLLATSLPATDVWLKLPKSGEKASIGMINFMPEKPNVTEADLGKKLSDTVKYDLLFTRYFTVIKPEITSQYATNKSGYFAKLAKQNVNVLLTGTVKLTDDTTLTLTAELYDTSITTPIFTKTYSDTKDGLRDMAHKTSDDIVLFLTGQQGIAHTKILFVNDFTGKKEIYMIDYDGHNLKRLTKDNSINLFPRWSPDKTKIIFTTYKYGNPDLYSINPDGTGKKAITTYQGLNTCASWSPDSQSILVTLSKGKSPNIYHVSSLGKLIHKVTFGNNINTSPWFSPNNNNLVFISDRAGYPQMYITDVEGTNAKRLYTDGYSDSPVWSPDGDKIIFSMRMPGSNWFNIYVYDISKDQYYRLTNDSGSNENPSISPDGRYIVFTSNRNNSKKTELYVMFIDGTGERKLVNIDGSCYTPNWGY
jgi:TolB protein